MSVTEIWRQAIDHLNRAPLLHVEIDGFIWRGDVEGIRVSSDVGSVRAQAPAAAEIGCIAIWIVLSKRKRSGPVRDGINVLGEQAAGVVAGADQPVASGDPAAVRSVVDRESGVFGVAEQVAAQGVVADRDVGRIDLEVRIALANQEHGAQELRLVEGLDLAPDQRHIDPHTPVILAVD